MIDAPEDGTRYRTPDGHTGKLSITRRERKLWSDGKLKTVRVVGTDGLVRVFDIEALIEEPPPPIEVNFKSELLDALSTLCACKRYKERNGKTQDYIAARDRAWKRAFELTGL